MFKNHNLAILVEKFAEGDPEKRQSAGEPERGLMPRQNGVKS
jgi:hypothetical protein